MRTALIIFLSIVCIVIGYAFRIPETHTRYWSFAGEPKTRAQLGEILFFETLLSSDQTVSCASCHLPAFAFADTVAFSKGVGGRTGKRNAMSCMNVNDRPYFFYDGRAATLEDQVKFPIEDPDEMNLPMAEAVKRLQNNAQYVRWFKSLYGSKPGEANLKDAIAAFERTLETANTPFDVFMKGDTGVISESAMRGREIFLGDKAKCFECHFTPDFTGDEFRNIGLYDGHTLNDPGRFAITGDSSDLGKFKVPGLRNVAITAPYMHNGMFRTLRQVIDYYDNPYNTVNAPVNMDSLLRVPLGLSEEEKTDLENFLRTLTDKRFVK